MNVILIVDAVVYNVAEAVDNIANIDVVVDTFGLMDDIIVAVLAVEHRGLFDFVYELEEYEIEVVEVDLMMNVLIHNKASLMKAE